ncbi:MAG: hypothetical protein LBC85_00945 [Fibromonadaceae bacterium]|jgi:hypothetical protein|nr:hypothetical protein [Fibromonadaceae bacterium]
MQKNTLFVVISLIVLAIIIYALIGGNNSNRGYNNKPRTPHNQSKDFTFESKQLPIEDDTIIENSEEIQMEIFAEQIVIFFSSAISIEKANKKINQMGGKVITQIPDMRYFLVEVPKGKEAEFILKAERDRYVNHVSQNMQSYPMFIIDDFTESMPNSKITHGHAVYNAAKKCCPECTFKPDIFDVGPKFLTKDIVQGIHTAFNQDKNKPVVINMSFGMPLCSLKVNIRIRSCKTNREGDIIKAKWTEADSDAQEYWIRSYKRFIVTNVLAPLQAYKENGRDFAITVAAGNNGSPVLGDRILDPLRESLKDGLRNAKLRKDKIGEKKFETYLEILNKHVLFVSAYEKNKDYSDRPAKYHDLVTAADISNKAVFPYPGSSFAAPDAGYCHIRRAMEKNEISESEAVQAIKNATKENAGRNGDLYTPGILETSMLDREARLIAIDKEPKEELDQMDQLAKKDTNRHPSYDEQKKLSKAARKSNRRPGYDEQNELKGQRAEKSKQHREERDRKTVEAMRRKQKKQELAAARRQQREQKKAEANRRKQEEREAAKRQKDLEMAGMGCFPFIIAMVFLIFLFS